jgi:hypothetical protein
MLLITLIFLAIQSKPVYASSVNGSNSGGGTGGMSSSTNYKAWSSSHQGYRFYLINYNLERVTPVTDVYFTIPSGVTTRLYTTRFDSASTPQSYRDMTLSEFKSYLVGCDTNIPYPVKDNEGHGDEFRKWFLHNLGSSTSPSSSSTTIINSSTKLPNTSKKHD